MMLRKPTTVGGNLKKKRNFDQLNAPREDKQERSEKQKQEWEVEGIQLWAYTVLTGSTRTVESKISNKGRDGSIL